MKLKHTYSILSALLPCALASVSKADLIAYWPLDEGSGFVAGDIIGGHDGQITGGSWFTPGKVGAAAYQGSGEDEIDCGTEPTPGTNDLTLSWWMIDNQDSYGTIMDKSGFDTGFGYNVLVRPSNEDSPLRFRIGGWQSYGGWNAECRLPIGAYAEGEWVHIVCTYDSATDTASIYVNGELPANGANNPKVGITDPLLGGYCESVNDPGSTLSIRGGRETFNGVLDEVAIWDEALTAQQVMTVYQQGVTIVSAPLPLALEVDSSGSDLVFAWQAQDGMLYNLKSSADLSADPSTWTIVEGGIGANETLGTISIARPAEESLFYIVEAYPAPPEPIN